MNKPRVVIVGGGFGGLTAARALSRVPVAITLVDRHNHHTFQPLLYQVATAGLSAGEIASPIRWILRKQHNVEVVMAEVTGIDVSARQIRLGHCGVDYDYLILAAGARHSYFGHDDWEILAPGLKSVEDARQIRERILSAFEAAERAATAGGAPQSPTFVVIGAGPTGVELAGTLAEISRHAMTGEFRHMDPSQTRIVLIEGGPRVLAAYPHELSQSAQTQLQKLGVEVMTSSVVTAIEVGAVHIGPLRIPAQAVLWAAGNIASPLGKMLGTPTDHAGRVLVEPDLSVPGHPEVFVIGDMAGLLDAAGRQLPGVAPVAMQQGEAVARSIARDALGNSFSGSAFSGNSSSNSSGESTGESRAAFHYRDKGSLATIGRAAAVADFGRLRLSGFLAWMAWLGVHIFFLIGFRNRLMVMMEWAWSYFTYGRGSRLITGSGSANVGGSTTGRTGQKDVHAGSD